MTMTLALAGTASAESRPAAVPGNAVAVARAFTFGVGLNGALGSSSNLQLTRGLSSSDARDTTAAAKGQVLDMGLVSTFNRQPTEACPAIIPLWKPETAPPVLVAESSDPASAASRPQSVLFPGDPTAVRPEAGIQDAVAGPGPTSGANSVVARADGGFMVATNLRSETRTSLDGAGRRSASSIVTADSIEVAGWFTLGNPRFAATSKTGSPGTATFTFDSITFFGVTTTGPAKQQVLMDAKNFVEGLFAGLGLKIELPTATGVGPDGLGQVRSNPSRDTTVLEEVGLTPLRVKLANIPLARDLLGPLIQTIEPQLLRDLNAYLLANECADQGASNTVSITLGVLSGNGELGTSIGQVSASTSDRWVAPPPPRPVVTTAPPAQSAVAVPAEAPEVLPSRTSRTDSTGSSNFRSGSTGSTGSSSFTAPPPVANSELVEEPVPEPPGEPPADDGVVPELAAPPTTYQVATVSSKRGGPLAWAGGLLLVGVLCAAFGDRVILARRRSS